MLVILAELFHKQSFLESLKRTPNMKWQAGIPKRFKGMTKDQVQSLISSQFKKIPALSTKQVGETPEFWSWKQERPECSGSQTVRDQEGCGSCWAFSAVNQLSDNRCINGLDKKRVQYSEQYVISCDKSNHGCDGGNLWSVQDFLDNTGTVEDSCIPYTSGATEKDGKCPRKCLDSSSLNLTKANSREFVCHSEEQIKFALTTGVVQTGFTVYTDLMYYESGIYEHVYGYVEGGHAVMFVGYGEENGIPYWTVKNSWGVAWGEHGFFRIIRGQNECEIENDCYLLTP